jgi:hypothetical protein
MKRKREVRGRTTRRKRNGKKKDQEKDKAAVNPNYTSVAMLVTTKV